MRIQAKLFFSCTITLIWEKKSSSGTFQRYATASIIFGSIYYVSASATFYIDSW